LDLQLPVQSVPIGSERNHRSPTRQKREENKFGEYVCVRTRQSGDRTSWGEFRLFCTCPCQPTWRSSFSVNDSAKFWFNNKRCEEILQNRW